MTFLIAPDDPFYDDLQKRPTYVYDLLNADGEVIYVGMTADVERRVRQHRRTVWGKAIASVRATEYPNRVVAGHAEGRRIAARRPRHNVLGASTPRTPAASCAPVEESPPSVVERPPTRGGGH